jgi:hypothetical protein
MKKVLLIVAMLLNALLMNAQSDSLKLSYKQVVNTLKDYRFISEDAYELGKTKSISLIVQKGNFVFTVVDDLSRVISSSRIIRHGKKVITVPISEVVFSMEYSSFTIGGENGIELAYKGKKEILRTYGIEGEDLTLKKLHKELNLLKDILIKENYQGNLGVSQAPKQSTKPKPAKQKEATNNQKQQRTRNRIPSGN